MTYKFSDKNDVITISNKPSLKGRVIGSLLLIFAFLWLAYIVYQYWLPEFDTKNAGWAFYPVLLIALTVFFSFNYKTVYFDLKSDSIIIVKHLVFSRTIYLKMWEVIGVKSVRNDHSYGGQYRNREHISPNHSFSSFLVLNSGKKIKLFHIHGRFWEKYFEYLNMLRKRTGLVLLDS